MLTYVFSMLYEFIGDEILNEIFLLVTFTLGINFP